MIRYTDTAIGFREVPGEISLLINISNCPHKCEGCHTPYLQQDTGNELTKEVFVGLLNKHLREITCVCFLGEGNDLDALNELINICNDKSLLTCLYTGCTKMVAAKNIIPKLYYLNFIKTGPYIAEKGGLDKETTNQEFFEIRWQGDTNGEEWYILEDLTHLFWKNNNNL